MSKELKIENQLDTHLKQIKIGETATPIEISTEKIRMNKDLICVENIEVEGGFNLNSRQILFPDQIVLEASEAQGGLSLEATGFSILSALWTGTDGDSSNNDAVLTLFPSAGQDAKIVMYGNAALQWTIGNDNDDSDKLKFDVGTTTVGGATKMTLDDNGNLTLVGDLAVNGDDITTDGNMNLDSGGSLTLDAHDGNFIAKKAGTEFSSANSAYAGMILGYTHLTSTDNTEVYTLTTSFDVIDADGKVTFVAPPSGNVEIEFSVYRDSFSSNKIVYFSLSDNATYNLASAEIGDGSSSIELAFTLGFDNADETDDRYLTGKFVVCGLTAGTSYTYWLGAKISTTSGYLRWGSRTSTDPDRTYPPFIIKATALPANIHTQ
tara:strand:+ start:3119 stop:4255 length:1137 start_codon:yes stop_codon:yes gene_type:complete